MSAMPQVNEPGPVGRAGNRIIFGHVLDGLKQIPDELDFTYLAQPPKRYTFEQPKLRTWVASWCRGKVLNLFAGRTLLPVDEFRVDIDPTTPVDSHMDAYQFVTSCTQEFDVVILDPPYNIRKAREKYGSRWIGKLTKIKDALPRILRPSARVITLGYDSVGMAAKRGFVKVAICLVCHGGDHNDTIVLVEEMRPLLKKRLGLFWEGER